MLLELRVKLVDALMEGDVMSAGFWVAARLRRQRRELIVRPARGRGWHVYEPPQDPARNEWEFTVVRRLGNRSRGGLWLAFLVLALGLLIVVVVVSHIVILAALRLRREGLHGAATEVVGPGDASKRLEDAFRRALQQIHGLIQRKLVGVKLESIDARVSSGDSGLGDASRAKGRVREGRQLVQQLYEGHRIVLDTFFGPALIRRRTLLRRFFGLLGGPLVVEVELLELLVFLPVRRLVQYSLHLTIEVLDGHGEEASGIRDRIDVLHRNFCLHLRVAVGTKQGLDCVLVVGQDKVPADVQLQDKVERILAPSECEVDSAIAAQLVDGSESPGANMFPELHGVHRWHGRLLP
mmetsp:Transcript_1623/g.3727  ORF Transcript_1623/g.3727 Transcript_1623/m.3727 type:complete len:352 (+) Transcript_1623:2341-3396(+)